MNLRNKVLLLLILLSQNVWANGVAIQEYNYFAQKIDGTFELNNVNTGIPGITIEPKIQFDPSNNVIHEYYFDGSLKGEHLLQGQYIGSSILYNQQGEEILHRNFNYNSNNQVSKIITILTFGSTTRLFQREIEENFEYLTDAINYNRIMTYKVDGFVESKNTTDGFLNLEYMPLSLNHRLETFKEAELLKSESYFIEYEIDGNTVNQITLVDDELVSDISSEVDENDFPVLFSAFYPMEMRWQKKYLENGVYYTEVSYDGITFRSNAPEENLQIITKGAFILSSSSPNNEIESYVLAFPHIRYVLQVVNEEITQFIANHEFTTSLITGFELFSENIYANEMISLPGN